MGYCTTFILYVILLLAGDVEQNPGPEFVTYSLSVFHANIRSIRNKFEYLKDEPRQANLCLRAFRHDKF